jgi:hypothetical protein
MEENPFNPGNEKPSHEAFSEVSQIRKRFLSSSRDMQLSSK